ncbi:MAG: hypothetical protein ACXW4I_11760 [Candidatus Deferrimicrobiaceae bacterium]
MRGTPIHRTILDGAAVPAGDWVKDDFLRLTRELDDGVRDLAKRCVDDILDTGLVLAPGYGSR